MKFSAVLVAAAGLSSTTEAIKFLNSNFNVVAGQPFTLTWSEATGPITILLKNGPSDNLGTIDTLATGQTGTSFTWSVPTDLASGLYAFEITDSADVNYSPQFGLDGTGVQAQTTTGYASSTAHVTPASSAAASSTTSKPVASLETLSTLTRPATTTAPTTVSAAFPKASNGTASSAAPTRTPPTSGSASPSQTSTPISTNAGAQAKSPLALIMVTVAALVYFN